jgi:hypothetical protein
VIHRALEGFARALLALATLVIVAACGSGGVGPPPVNDPAAISVLPKHEGDCLNTVTNVTCQPVIAYSGLPTTFTITGGTGSYIVSSTNQAIIPVSGTITGQTLTVIPNPVVSETSVNVTARDTGSTPPTTVQVLVRPGTVSNTITIAPASSACAPAVCSGGDAVVSATISQGGIPLPARGVRFDVISGDVRFITSPAGQPEATALSVSTTTDETGVARARLRALDTAANQTAIIQVTDLGTGAFHRTTVLVARATSTETGFFTVPTSITYTGPNNATCASGITSEVFIFGGTPPYRISNSQPTAFNVNTTQVNASGGSFRVTPTGICGEATIGVTDAANRTTTMTVRNQPGSNPAPTPAPLTVAPTSVTLSSCTQTASVFAVGGQATAYLVTPSSNVLLASSSGNLVTIRRTPGTDATGLTGLEVAISDGREIKTVSVSLAGGATGFCP